MSGKYMSGLVYMSGKYTRLVHDWCGRYLVILGKPIRVTVPAVHRMPHRPWSGSHDKVVQPTTQSAEGCTMYMF